MQKIELTEQYGLKHRGHSYDGEVEIIVLDKRGRKVQHFREHNIVKIFAKEILAHRMAHSKIWDPTANADAGGWVASGIDPDEDFAAKYIMFGASFDENGVPLDTTDDRYYTLDPVTGTYIPITLGVGAEYGGGLINAIPIAEPDRALKKIERIYFEPTYQPSGTPLLQEDVRAMNNVVVLETTLRKEEYNGFGLTESDFFTITEVALAAGKEFDTIGSCECTPKELFLEGKSGGASITATTTGTSTITIDPADVAYVDVIKEGDQVKIVDQGDTAQDEVSLDQLNPHYLVISKAVGGSDIVLDRTPVDTDNNALTGQVGVFRDTLRIFSHRILKVPFKKSSDFEIIVRWRIIMN